MLVAVHPRKCDRCRKIYSSSGFEENIIFHRSIRLCLRCTAELRKLSWDFVDELRKKSKDTDATELSGSDQA